MCSFNCDIDWDKADEDELEGMTGFQFDAQLEVLECMLKIAVLNHKGLIHSLPKTQEAMKTSIEELCQFFNAFARCL